MGRTAKNMKKLIENEYYDDAETAAGKLDMLMLANRVTDEEYTELAILISQKYESEIVDESDSEPTEE